MLDKPDFCFITPIPLLEQFASQSSKHLCLAHLVDSNDQYASFYKKNERSWRLCDNGQRLF